MAQSVEHIVHIDGVVGSSPTVTTKAEAVENQRLLFLSKKGRKVHIMKSYQVWNLMNVITHLSESLKELTLTADFLFVIWII